MSNCLKLHYDDLLDKSEKVDSNPTLNYQRIISADKTWGKFEEATYVLPYTRISEIKTDFVSDSSVKIFADNMPTTVHICIPLHGKAGVEFKEFQWNAYLNKYEHHYAYVPELEFNMLTSSKSHVLHFEIDREYFLTLLCDNEDWSASLKEKLLKQRFVHSAIGVACTSMLRIMNDILNCTLSGNLKKLFIEAKMLELTALQLNQAHQLRNYRSIKGQDLDTMMAIREFLTKNFDQDLSLNLISKNFGINEFKLKKNFREAFGYTIFNYIFDLKMQHAKQLLLDEKMFVNEVAASVGYKNANHFSTAFKKKYGINPALLRG